MDFSMSGSLVFSSCGKNVCTLAWQSDVRLEITFRSRRCRALLPFQEGLLALGISPEPRGALLGLAWDVRGKPFVPCFKGERERGTNLEEEVEGQTLASQRLAEVQTLG